MTQQSKNAYLAGLLDACGDFDVDSVRLVFTVRIGLAAQKYLIQQFGGCKSADGWFWRHEFAAPSAKTEVLLLGVLPYLILKRDDANQGLQLVRNNATVKAAPKIVPSVLGIQSEVLEREVVAPDSLRLLTPTILPGNAL